MSTERKALAAGNLLLSFLDFSIEKFFDMPALNAYEVIMVPALV